MSPDPVWPGLFLPCSLPRLLPAAAGGGLEPSPARRFRGAFPHRLLSYAKEPSVAVSFAHGAPKRRAWQEPVSLEVVYGHHPIHSAGRYQDSPRMKERLLPILRSSVAIYFAGHDHDMQALKADAGVHFFVVGGGGASLRPLTAQPHSLMAKSFHGFAILEADEAHWEVIFYDADLNVMYRLKNL